ncbi:MAG: hypothetical protein WCG87_01085 [Bacteroidota bacterium]
MKLYPKRLNSLAELKKEKHMLMLAKKESELPDVLSFDLPLLSGLGKKKDVEQASEDDNIVVDLIASFIESPDLSNLITTVAKPILNYAKDKAGTSILKSAAKEVIGGYAKWKAIELGFRGVKHLVKTKMDKRKKD